jgi:hypothetical protein
MIKKKNTMLNILSFSLLIASIMVSCASSGSVGTKMPPANYPRLTMQTFGKEAVIPMKHLILYVTPTLENDVIHATGRIQFHRDKLPRSSELKNLNITALLMDKDYTVVEKVKFRTSGQIGMYDVPFKTEVPFSEKYAFIAFSYRFRYEY